MNDPEIPSGEPQEGQTQPPQEETPQPPPPSDILVRYRGEEIPIPAEGIEALAKAFNTTPERTVSWVQMQMDANRAWNEAERHKQRADTLEEQWQRHLQNQRQPEPQYGGNGYTQPPNYAPPPTYYAPPGAPGPGYNPPYPPAQDDPIQLLHATRQEIQQMRRDWQEEQKRFHEAQQRQALEQDQARWDAAADRFLEERNKGRKKPVTRDELLGEVQLSGMHLSPLPPERIFDKAWRVVTYDDAGPAAQAELMRRLKEPTARVTIPGAPTNQPPPASQKPKEPDFGNITMRDISESIPITRTL